MKKLVLSLMIIGIFAGCSSSSGIPGTYYKTQTGGSALFFRPDNNPKQEIGLMGFDQNNMPSDAALYDKLGLSEYYDDSRTNCLDFHGTATLTLKEISKTSDTSFLASIAEVSAKTEPVCGPLK